MIEYSNKSPRNIYLEPSKCGECRSGVCVPRLDSNGQFETVTNGEHLLICKTCSYCGFVKYFNPFKIGINVNEKVQDQESTRVH